MRFERVADGFVRDIEARHFPLSAVVVSKRDGTQYITVDDVTSRLPSGQVTGGRRYAFLVEGEMSLVQNSHSEQGRHDYVTGALATGPIVFFNSTTSNSLNDTGPHDRWSNGLLFDNITVNGDRINVQNRWDSGAGHGWAGANVVVWNSEANSFIVQSPPTAQNWLIGSKGTINSGNTHGIPSETIHESSGVNGQRVSMGNSSQNPNDSLYIAQLLERQQYHVDQRFWTGAGNSSDWFATSSGWGNWSNKLTHNTNMPGPGPRDDVVFHLSEDTPLTTSPGQNTSIASLQFDSPIAPVTVNLNNTDSRLTIGNRGVTVFAGSHAITGTSGGNGALSDIHLAGDQAWEVRGNSQLAVDAKISSDGGLTKVGSGTLGLNGQFAYAGTTTVREGLLRVNNVLNGNVTVLNGAALGGNGFISGNVTAGNGGIIAPGKLTQPALPDQPETVTLLSHWKLDETSNGTVVNEVGLVHGVNQGAMAGQVGIAGTAYQFGNNSWVDTGFHPVPADGEFSAFMWIKAPHQTSKILLGANYTQAGRWTLQLNSLGTLMFFHNPTGNMISSLSPVDDEWHHVEITRADQVVTLWMDGVPEAVSGTFSGVLNDDFNLALGARFTDISGTQATAGFIGLMDDVQIYDTALSASQIDWLIQNPGQAIPLLPDGEPQQPIDAEPATLTVGSFALHDGSHLELVIGGVEPGQFDRLVVEGSATIDGSLDVTLIDDFTPTAGELFEVLYASDGILGEFAATSLPALPNGMAWDVVYSNFQVLLEVETIAIAGDFDGDGDVDGADFVIWQTNLPTPSGATLSMGDADGDGDVDGADFVIWQTNFPFTPDPGVSALPEPHSFVMAAIGGLVAALLRRRKVLSISGKGAYRSAVG